MKTPEPKDLIAMQGSPAMIEKRYIRMNPACGRSRMKDELVERTIKLRRATAVVDCDGEKHYLWAERYRASNGMGHIRIRLGKQSIEFSSDLEDYEHVARELASLLIEACDEPCALPEVSK